MENIQKMKHKLKYHSEKLAEITWKHLKYNNKVVIFAVRVQWDFVKFYINLNFIKICVEIGKNSIKN